MKKSIVFIGIIFLMLLGTTVALAAVQEVVVKATAENNRIYVGDKTRVGFTAVFTDLENPSKSITLDSYNFADNGVIQFNSDCFKVSYSSDNSRIAAVDDKGVVTGISAGSATVTQKITFNYNYEPGPLLYDYYNLNRHGSCDLSAVNELDPNKFTALLNHSQDTFIREVKITVVPDDRFYLCLPGKEPAPVKMTMNAASFEIDRLCVGAKMIVDFSVTMTDVNDPAVKYTFNKFRYHGGEPLDSGNLTVSYSSDNGSVATVDRFGVVTGISEGWANITVNLTVNPERLDQAGLQAKVRKARLAVKPPDSAQPVTFTRQVSILVHPAPVMNNVILAQSEFRQLTIVAPPGFDKGLLGFECAAWMIRDPSIAKVDINTGMITGLRPGKTTAVYFLKTSRENPIHVPILSSVTVYPVMAIYPERMNVYIGTPKTLNVSFDSWYTGNKNGTWSIADRSIASIDQSGKVTGLKPGTTTATFTITDTGAQTDCTVVVAETPFRIAPNPLEIDNGETEKLNVTFDRSFTGNKAGTWSVADRTIASVEDNSTAPIFISRLHTILGRIGAKVTGLKPGTTTVTYINTATGAQQDCVVTVKPAFQIAPDPLTVYSGETGNLTVSYDDGYTDSTNGMWSVEDNTVASIDQNGVVTGKEAGTTTATYTIFTPIRGIMGIMAAFESARAQGKSAFPAFSSVRTVSVVVKAAPYTVSFDAQGGSPEPESVTVMPDTTVARPADPSLKNMVFLGWYTAPSEGDKWNFANAKVTADMTLYAQWRLVLKTDTSVRHRSAYDMPTITGPSTIDLLEGYADTNQAYTFGGDPAPTYGISLTAPNTANATFAGTTLTIPSGLDMGSYEVTLTAANSAGTVTKTITVNVSTTETEPTITGPDTINLMEGYDSTDQAYAFDGDPAPTYGISPSALNTAGATFSGITLTIPEGLVAGAYEVTLTAANSAGTADKTVTVNVCPQIVLTIGSEIEFYKSIPVTHTLSASGGDGGPYEYTIASGSMPAGLTLSSAGLIVNDGSAVTGDFSSIQLRIEDSSGNSRTIGYIVRVFD